MGQVADRETEAIAVWLRNRIRMDVGGQKSKGGNQTTQMLTAGSRHSPWAGDKG